jgi:hypothetical protein
MILETIVVPVTYLQKVQGEGFEPTHHKVKVYCLTTWLPLDEKTMNEKQKTMNEKQNC